MPQLLYRTEQGDSNRQARYVDQCDFAATVSLGTCTVFVSEPFMIFSHFCLGVKRGAIDTRAHLVSLLSVSSSFFLSRSIFRWSFSSLFVS